MSRSDDELPISREQLAWCDRLWTSLKQGARWILPQVGVYTKTSPSTLALTELYFSTPVPDAFGGTAFDSHDWVRLAGSILNWTIDEEIEIARDWNGDIVENWPKELIGQVAVCSYKCGTIVRAEPYQAGKYYTQLHVTFDIGPSSLKGPMRVDCPTCGEDGFEDIWCEAWVVVDDSATKLRESLGIGEEE